MSENYQPISSSVNGSGFRPFDMIIPFAFRPGEITGKLRHRGEEQRKRRAEMMPSLSFLSAGEVLMPSGKSAQPLIADNGNGTVIVQYAPTEPGLHEMHIKYNGTHIPGWYRRKAAFRTL